VALTSLIWSERFRDELQREFEFLRERNPDAAKVVIERIIKASRRLRDFPKSGRIGRLAGAWELVVPGLPYVVAYDIDRDGVVLLMLFHTSRQVPNVH
jgi:addiction module RelE/StbE family toxin